jgi:hypothetical protein
MDWQLDFVNCSEASVPVRSLDLIGFEFLTLTQDLTGTVWPPSPPPPPMWCVLLHRPHSIATTQH